MSDRGCEGAAATRVQGRSFWPRQGLILSIRLYQCVVRPLTGCNCRFHPSCSEYGIQALRAHGAVRGTLLTARRVLRCNPWVPGGDDPVPT